MGICMYGVGDADCAVRHRDYLTVREGDGGHVAHFFHHGLPPVVGATGYYGVCVAVGREDVRRWILDHGGGAGVGTWVGGPHLVVPVGDRLRSVIHPVGHGWYPVTAESWALPAVAPA